MYLDLDSHVLCQKPVFTLRKNSDLWMRCRKAAHMSTGPTPLHTNIKEVIWLRLSACFFSPLSFAHMASRSGGVPRSEVVGTNNYDQRNYNVKGTDATFRADKSLQARGHADSRRRGGDIFHATFLLPLSISRSKTHLTSNPQSK